MCDIMRPFPYEVIIIFFFSVMVVNIMLFVFSDYLNISKIKQYNRQYFPIVQASLAMIIYVGAILLFICK